MEKARCHCCWEFKLFEEFLYFDIIPTCNECLTLAHVGYVAGFFDGEGHVQLNHNLGIRFAQAEPEPLHFIMERFPRGLLYHQQNKGRGIYNLVYNGRFAVPICTAMLPFLIVKHEEVKTFLAYENS